MKLVALLLSTLVCGSSTVPAFAQAGKAADLTNDQARLLQEEMIPATLQRFSQDRALMGAWAKLRTVASPGQVEAVLYVDGRDRDRQLAAVRRVLAEAFGPLLREMSVVTVPVAEMAERFNALAESDPALDGTFLDGGNFTIDGNQSRLCLIGRIPNEDVRELVVQKYKQHVGWSLLAEHEFVADGSTLQISPTEPLRGRSLLADALTFYRAGQYVKAERIFRLAVVEQPERLDYRFWLASCCLARNDEAGAERYIRAAAQRWKGRFSSSERSRVNYSLAQVQGYHRARLHELETGAVSSWYLNTSQAAATRRVPFGR